MTGRIALETGVIIYTTEVGGFLKATWGSKERYERLKAAGTIQELPSVDRHPETPLKMICFAEVAEVFDFVLGRPR